MEHSEYTVIQGVYSNTESIYEYRAYIEYREYMEYRVYMEYRKYTAIQGVHKNAGSIWNTKKGEMELTFHSDKWYNLKGFNLV